MLDIPHRSCYLSGMNKPKRIDITPQALEALLKRAEAALDRGDYELIKAMKDIMCEHQGIGLAAPQVGRLERIILADIGEGLLSLANPVIIKKEGQDNQGCLSLPDVEVDGRRNQEIKVTGINTEGEEEKME